MNFSKHALAILATLGTLGSTLQNVAAQEEEQMVKMCLFYPNASGHARSDPILNQVCPSDHVHTFYGPTNFHPNTTYQQLRDTRPENSSSPWQENQSLYWHPSIYEVGQVNGQTTYTRVSELETSPYYRWDTTTPPETVAFPPDFRMIAYSNQDGANGGGETGQNLFVECCDMRNGEEDCENFEGHPLRFPKRNCDFLGIAFAMPTCWDESKGVGLFDPFGHVAYTVDGTVSGNCPTGYNKRIPQVQLFVRIGNYRGADFDYQLSDGSDAFHVDFMNGWQEGKLDQIIRDCQPSGEPGYNPPCDCDQFLTASSQPSGQVCDEDVKQYVLNEETAVVTTLPRGTCQGTDLIEKSWDVDPPFTCTTGGGGGPGDDDEGDEGDDEPGNDDEGEEGDDEPGDDDEEEEEEEGDDEPGDDDEEEEEEGDDDEEEEEEEGDDDEEEEEEEGDDDEEEEDDEDGDDEEEEEDEDGDDEEEEDEDGDDEEEEEDEDGDDEEEEEEEGDDDEEEEDEGDDEPVDDDEGGAIECTDSTSSFKLRKNVFDCNWVAQKPARRCRNERMKSHCPVTCDAPEYCEDQIDSMVPVYVQEIDNFRKCQWVQRNPDRICSMVGMCSTCRGSCAGYDNCN